VDELTVREVLELSERLMHELPCEHAPPGYVWSPVAAWAMSQTGDLYRWLVETNHRVSLGHRIVVSVEDMLEFDAPSLCQIARSRQESLCSQMVLHRLHNARPPR
jgi:hypothetical protein